MEADSAKGKQYFGWSSFWWPIRPQCLYDLALPLPAFMCLGLLCGTQWPLIKDWAQALRRLWRHSYQMPSSQNSARPPEINACIVSHWRSETMSIFRFWFEYCQFCRKQFMAMGMFLGLVPSLTGLFFFFFKTTLYYRENIFIPFFKFSFQCHAPGEIGVIVILLCCHNDRGLGSWIDFWASCRRLMDILVSMLRVYVGF